MMIDSNYHHGVGHSGMLHFGNSQSRVGPDSSNHSYLEPNVGFHAYDARILWPSCDNRGGSNSPRVLLKCSGKIVLTADVFFFYLDFQHSPLNRRLKIPALGIGDWKSRFRFLAIGNDVEEYIRSKPTALPYPLRHWKKNNYYSLIRKRNFAVMGSKPLAV